MSKPTLIVAPGAWYPPTALDPLIAKLTSHGYICKTVAFPSVQKSAEVKGLIADINAVRGLVEPAVNAGQDVIVISHSWSGLPEGGGTKLIFISAFLPDIGHILIGAFGGYIQWVGNGTVMADKQFTLFFHDVPDSTEWVTRLRPHAWATKNSPATADAYVDISLLHICCGARIETEKVKTAHITWLVVPDHIAASDRNNAGKKI
ncbi:alpha/beta hydrolase [Aspergillus alliaceus]|uniref:alpha/beta hydrolase n=1 Tax=Petromyces alliaceus TaxID=209559 RepID=UPI0012A729B6|nr:uncharacterized protein BDW43DRAFT_323709 [Aspergillus alliaceus]KAB8236640.1 hypothetical protein BDW43DRAFT_323709 [Aspergillus alliaceus]